MPLFLEISDGVIQALGLPRETIERELRTDPAVALYARGALSMGKATEMSGRNRWEFEDVLAERKIARNYSMADLEHDLAWAERELGGAKHGPGEAGK